MRFITDLYHKFAGFCNLANPAFLLVLRLVIAQVFWNSGLVKIHDWEGTLFLFSDEYHVPLLPPMIAAVFATVFELGCSVLLAAGFLARAAALPLIVMTAVINFTYQELPEHYYWAILLGTVLFMGPGKLSLDYFLGRKFAAKK